MDIVDPLIERLEEIDRLDARAGSVAQTVGSVLPQNVRSALAGTWIGHPLHPVLTDLPIGFWTSAFVVDLVGGRRGRPASQTMVGLGVLSAVPTALAGLVDWADTTGKTRRVGTFHALVNSTAVACFSLSWIARRRGHHGTGVLLGMAGSAAATAGASLGGHLVYRTGTGVDVNANAARPETWTGGSEEQTAAGASYVVAGGTEVLATEDEAGWHGIDARCSHRGGPLQEGAISAGCVECPWHGSRFRLDDGRVERGPATAPQRRYDVRHGDDGLEVRARG